MDFSKYVSLISTKHIHFSSIENLMKKDPYEGSLAKGNLDFHEITYEQYKKGDIKFLEPINSEADFKRSQNFLKIHKEEFIKQRKAMYVNCWHMNAYESSAMWAAYIGNHSGVAITSTYEKLKTSLTKQSKDIYIGTIKYIDYNLSFINENNSFFRAMHKDISYEHEKELRAFHCDLGEYSQNKDKVFPDGIPISIDLVSLIDEIIVSPTSPTWYLEMVQSVSRKYDINVPIRPSKLSINPFA